ncbi:MAG: NADH-quinone oxidoreductase subunit NuoF [Candidatus Firestonebacteria bacterium]
MRFNSIEDLKKYAGKLKENLDTKRTVVRICTTGCRAFGAIEVLDAFLKEVKERKLEKKIEIRQTGCHGLCAKAPVLAIDPDGIFYQQVSPKDVPEIISKTILKGEILTRLVYADLKTGEKYPYAKDVPFYKEQLKIVLRNCGYVDPTNIDNYLIREGYLSLIKVLTLMKPEEVIEEIKKSGLRGRGGAGFPTGKKWEFVRNAKVTPKYIICNGDEGDPGAFMDRAVLEGDPHSVLEGMLIAAYALGANEGYIYVRAEYPIAVYNLKIAINKMKETGLLGDNILGTGFSFKLYIKEGAGAFVCGEETALIASLEGKRGIPRVRPPFPAEKGLFGKPTNINNVETYANIAPIILKGSEWYSSLGTATSKGTKVFSLAGKINNTGLVEVQMGITLRKIIFDIGGGIPRDRKFKAVQTGGPSGGCIPEKYLDLPVDYESLSSKGAIMGSGGMIITDEDTCMVDLAKFFLNFLRDESCGKCVPCRIGTQRMYEILDKITKGVGTREDIDLLKELAESVKDTSLCGLGQTSANPVLSTLSYFKDEYISHIDYKKCPAKVCTVLINYFIIENKCTGCMVCAKNCPQNAISGERKKPHIINQSKCIKCGICESACNFNAIEVK